MSKLKRVIIKLGIVLALMSSAIITWEVVQHFCFNDNNIVNVEDEMRNNVTNQKLIEQYINSKEFKVDRFIESIDTTQEIILMEETGISNITLKKNDGDFWSFLLESQVDIAVEYKAIISVDPNDIKFTDGGDHVIIEYDTSNIHVKSVEILNENIIVNRKIFGSDFSDDVKITLRKVLVNNVKDQIMRDKNVITGSLSSLEEFYNNMAKKFGVEVRFYNSGNFVSHDGFNYSKTSYVPASYYEYYEYDADGIHPYNWNSNQATTISVGGVCGRHTNGNTSPYMNVSTDGWNSHYTQTHYSVVEEGGNIVGAGVKANDQYVKIINNEMNYRDPQYGYLPIYAVNINQVKEYGKVYGSELYGSIIEIEYPDGTVRKGIVLDACGQCAKEAKIDLWVYHNDNSKHINDVQFRFVRFGWGNSYNENIFKTRMSHKA